MRVVAYDPVAGPNTRAHFAGNELLSVVDDQYAVLEEADCLAVVTEWNQFRNPDFTRIKKMLKAPIIFDGRNLYSPQLLADLGIAYVCIGRQATKA